MNTHFSDGSVGGLTQDPAFVHGSSAWISQGGVVEGVGGTLEQSSRETLE